MEWLVSYNVPADFDEKLGECKTYEDWNKLLSSAIKIEEIKDENN